MKRILIVGAGFAGMWSALSAMRILEEAKIKPGTIEVVVVAPQPTLVVRPRLYEAEPVAMGASLQELFEVTGVKFVAGVVEKINTSARSVEIVGTKGNRFDLGYDRLVLAAGSRLFRPNIPGLVEHAFSIDQIDEAIALKEHFEHLAKSSDNVVRNTVVVAGGGFTGLEIAAELPERLKKIFGRSTGIRVIVVEQADVIGPDLGPGPRPVILDALKELGVEMKLGSAVTRIDADGIETADGTRIDTNTVIWTAGVRASELTKQIDGERDRLGRLIVDRDLRVPAVPDVFATGDTACAATDELGNNTVMSCQHAINLGKSAGNNAAADLVGMQPEPYSQPFYGTCLALGPWGAVRTKGWERTVIAIKQEARERKRLINEEYIYPPKAVRKEALAAANPVITVPR